MDGLYRHFCFQLYGMDRVSTIIRPLLFRIFFYTFDGIFKSALLYHLSDNVTRKAMFFKIQKAIHGLPTEQGLIIMKTDGRLLNKMLASFPDNCVFIYRRKFSSKRKNGRFLLTNKQEKYTCMY